MAEEYRLHLALSLHHAGAHPLAREVVDPWWVACHLLAGDRRAVTETLEERYADALVIDDGLARPLWALPKALDRWLAGDLSAAEHFAREAMGVPDAVVSIRRMATHVLARVLGLAGRFEESIIEARATAGDDYVGIVTNWSAGLEHDVSLADPGFVSPSTQRDSERSALDAIGRLRGQGQLVAAAWVADDVVRAGGVQLVAEDLTALAADTDAASVGWMAAHAAGLVDRDAARLMAGAESAAHAGCHAVAVLIADDAVEVAVGRRDAALAAAAASLADEVRRRTNGMAEARRVGALGERLGLSPREAEVARAATAGLTDQQIGEELFISVRTVHAHLRSVYRKLGISGRHELISD